MQAAANAQLMQLASKICDRYEQNRIIVSETNRRSGQRYEYKYLPKPELSITL